jgi:hypothetical protein
LSPAGEKRNQKLAKIPQAPANEGGTIETRKISSKTMTRAPRILLNKEGFMKVDKKVTAMSLFSTFKLMYEKCKLKVPPDMQKIMISFIVVMGELSAEQEFRECSTE